MPTRNARLDHDFIARLDPRYELADFPHDAGHIATEYVREGNLDPRQTVANKNVEMIQRARLHLDEDFVRTNLRLGHVRVLEHFWSTVLSEDRGFHFAACSRA
jgi:hypothetical protein